MFYNFKVGQNALIQAIRKVSLINSVYTYTNNFTFTAGFDHPTIDFNTESSNLHVAVSQMRAVVLVHDKIQANLQGNLTGYRNLPCRFTEHPPFLM